MIMYIVNQDRDLIIQKTGPLQIAPAYYNGTLVGINLCNNGLLLGTFDEEDDALIEAIIIEECDELGEELYFVEGFCAGEDDLELIQAMLEGFNNEEVI
jgi:hypothetical protein